MRRQRRLFRRDRQPGGRLRVRPAGALRATVMFSEVTEVRDAIHLLTRGRLTKRSVNVCWKRWPGTITILIWAKPTAALTPPRQQERRSGQRGGKALGSIAKSGKSAIVEVLSGAASDQTRPHLRRNPASDFVCGTQQVASGITVQVFTTGRGTPYGLMAVPVIKWRPVPSWPTAGMT